MKFDAKQVDFIVGLVNKYCTPNLSKEYLIKHNDIETYLSEKDEAFRDVFPYMDKYVDKDGCSVNAIYNPFEDLEKEQVIGSYLVCNSKSDMYDLLLENTDPNYYGNYYVIIDMSKGYLEAELIKEEDFNVKYTKTVAKLV